MSKTVLTLIAEGFEEIEAVTPIDLFRRAGIDVTTASITSSPFATGKVGIQIATETLLPNVSSIPFDCLFIPGGPGTESLVNNQQVISLVREQHKAGRLIAAICAAPLVLKAAGTLPHNYTAHFSVKDKLPNIQESPVVSDQNVITSRGAGTAIPFALEVIRTLTDKETADNVAQSICYA